MSKICVKTPLWLEISKGLGKVAQLVPEYSLKSPFFRSRIFIQQKYSFFEKIEYSFRKKVILQKKRPY